MALAAKHVLIVYNPEASAGNADLWLGTIVNRLCAQLACAATTVATTPDSTHENLLPYIERGPDLVVAAGGDGTIRLVIGAIIKSRLPIPLGIVPLGTANILARNLGLYEDTLLGDPLEGAVNAICAGHKHKIDLGVMNGHYFCVAAGAGPYAEATVSADRFDKGSWRLLAYATSLLHTFAMPPMVFRISADNDVFEIAASGIFVSNVSNMGTALLSESALLDDGFLDMCILNPSHFHEYVQLGFHFAGGFMGGEAPFYIRKAKNIIIENLPVRSPMSSFQRVSHRVRGLFAGKANVLPPRHKESIAVIDGDACGTLPMYIEVIPQAISIFVPERAV